MSTTPFVVFVESRRIRTSRNLSQQEEEDTNDWGMRKQRWEKERKKMEMDLGDESSRGIRT